MPTSINSKLLSWATIIDDGTIRQAERLSRLDVVTGHVALMPDAHFGIDATVGSVIPTESAILPAAIGTDTGCGVVAAELDVTASQLPDDLGPLLSTIDRIIPGGPRRGSNEHVSARAETWMASHQHHSELTSKQQSTALGQFGTLGGGNHFIEVCLDERDHVWVTLHSGSRGIGSQLAMAHIALAQTLARNLQLRLEDPSLAYFLEGTQEFKDYITDMLWAQDYALANREQMMDRVMRETLSFIGTGREISRINCLAGDTVVKTRKGDYPIESLAGGEHELLTSGGRWVKAPILSFGKQRVYEIVLSRSGVIKRIRATAEHRWFVRPFYGDIYEATTESLQPGSRLEFSFPTIPKNRKVDKAAAARGFVYGDGSAVYTRPNGKAHASFCGSKDEVMLPFFEGLGGPLRTYSASKRIAGLPREWKTETIPITAKVSEIYGWLAGYFAADGDVGKTGRPTIVSVRKENLEYFRMACQKVGIGTFGIRSRMHTGFGTTPHPMYLMGIMRGDLTSDFFINPEHRSRFEAGRNAAERRGWNVISVIPTEHEEEVYCAVVEETHSFTLEDNILTGNCHHNFAAQEVFNGVPMWITRKGAIRAQKGDLGMIPGSMGAQSYIIEGLGNELSWNSCAHGAGRIMSRGDAKRAFTVADIEEQMQGKTWLSSRAAGQIDEIPGAYKDIDQVMADQRDLVSVHHVLRQVLNFKGC